MTAYLNSYCANPPSVNELVAVEVDSRGKVYQFDDLGLAVVHYVLGFDVPS